MTPHHPLVRSLTNWKNWVSRARPSTLAHPMTRATVPSSPEKHPLSPASSFLSEIVERPTKKRRVSVDYSSLSEQDDDDDDEEERPLAAGVPKPPEDKGRGKGGRATGARSGKGVSSMKAKAQTAPANIPPPNAEQREAMRAGVNGANGRDAQVKVEDKMDAGQLSRLVTGVTVDAAGPASAAVRAGRARSLESGI